MGLEKNNPDENEEIDPVLESNIEDAIPAVKKKGRPKKEKKDRTPAQLANDEKQRQRFKKEHESRKSPSAPKIIKNKTKVNQEEIQEEVKPKPKTKTKAKQETDSVEVENNSLTEPQIEVETNSGSEIDEETVYIKRKPRKKSKRTYVIEPDSDSSSDEEYTQRRKIPTPQFSANNDIFTLTFK